MLCVHVATLYIKLMVCHTAIKERKSKEGASIISRPPVGTISEGNDPFAPGRKDKPKRPKGKKITKQDIGLPQDFRCALSRVLV